MNTSGFSAVVKQIYQYEEVKCIEMHLLSSEVSTIEISKVGHNLALFQACSRKKKKESKQEWEPTICTEVLPSLPICTIVEYSLPVS